MVSSKYNPWYQNIILWHSTFWQKLAKIFFQYSTGKFESKSNNQRALMLFCGDQYKHFKNGTKWSAIFLKISDFENCHEF